MIVGARLRRSAAASAHGAVRLVRDALTTARRAGVTGQVLVRADSAYYQHAFVTAVTRAGARFSVGARQDSAVRRAIASIDDRASRPALWPGPAATPHRTRRRRTSWPTPRRSSRRAPWRTGHTAAVRHRLHVPGARVHPHESSARPRGRGSGTHEVHPAVTGPVPDRPGVEHLCTRGSQRRAGTCRQVDRLQVRPGTRHRYVRRERFDHRTGPGLQWDGRHAPERPVPGSARWPGRSTPATGGRRAAARP